MLFFICFIDVEIEAEVEIEGRETRKEVVKEAVVVGETKIEREKGRTEVAEREI